MNKPHSAFASERKVKLPELVEQGMKLKEMAELFGVSYPQIQQDLKAIGQYRLWQHRMNQNKQKERKEKQLAEKSVIQTENNFYSTLYKYAKEEHGRAGKLAVDYIKRHGITRVQIPYQTVVSLFERVFFLRQYKMKESLEEITERIGNISPMRAAMILRDSGIEPPNGSRTTTSREKSSEMKDKIKILYRKEYSNADICYFLDTNTWLVEDATKKMKRNPSYIKGIHGLNLKTASKIYKMMSRGARPKSIVEKLKVTDACVDEAINSMAELRQRIIYGLELRFERKVDEPYL